MEAISEDQGNGAPLEMKESHQSQQSQTAADFIDQQLALEADAREILPYKFDKCTHILGPLRQEVYACLTCSPPPASAAQVYQPAGVCYACSISCHGEHHLVELFNRRNFVCDCGTTRLPDTTPCRLRSNPETGRRGVHSQEPAKGNQYNQNFQNKFCACGEEYDAETEKGTMFQCIGLGTVGTGGCGEDWYHPECLMGLPKDWNKDDEAKKEQKPSDGDEEKEEQEHPLPLGFPAEDDFEHLVCYKCVESHPWIKAYAGTPGFLAPVWKRDAPNAPAKATHAPQNNTEQRPNLKRKASDSDSNSYRPSSPTKRVKEDTATTPEPPPTGATTAELTEQASPRHKHHGLPSPPGGIFSLFLKSDFRDHLCHCPRCYPNLLPHPHLLDEEDTYEPSLSSSASHQAPNGSHSAQSQGSRSIYDRGEAALNNIDRVRAIEGVMVYNHLRDKVKEFLKPYAESGKVVSAEDIKGYFEKLRGDQEAIKEAGKKAEEEGGGGGGGEGGNRREQSGY